MRSTRLKRNKRRKNAFRKKVLYGIVAISIITALAYIFIGSNLLI